MPNKQRVIDALNHIEDMHESHGVTGAIELHEHGYHIIMRKDLRYLARIVAWEDVDYGIINPLCAMIDRMAEEMCPGVGALTPMKYDYIRG